MDLATAHALADPNFDIRDLEPKGRPNHYTEMLTEALQAPGEQLAYYQRMLAAASQ